MTDAERLERIRDILQESSSFEGGNSQTLYEREHRRALRKIRKALTQ